MDCSFACGDVHLFAPSLARFCVAKNLSCRVCSVQRGSRTSVVFY